MYRKTKQPERLDAICKELLLLDAPDPNAIAFVAETYAVQGRTTEAADVLARLDKLQAAPGVKEIIRGDVVSEVDVQTPWGIVTSVITTRSVDELQLKPGSDVVALVKSTEVSIAKL